MEKSRNWIVIFFVLSIVGGVFLAMLGIGIAIIAFIATSNHGDRPVRPPNRNIVNVKENREVDPVNVDNFNKIGKNGYTSYFAAQELFGPANSSSQFGHIFSATWRSRDGRCIITVSYEVMEHGDGFFKGKSINRF